MTDSKTLIFTDMDGTLLDHYTYDFSPVVDTLATLESKAIPVIPTTSKTFAELQILRERIGLFGPFIIENGAAICIPHGFFKQKPAGTVWQDNYWCKSFSYSKNYWVNLLDVVADEFQGEFKQFSKMSLQDIQDATGLDEKDASLAAMRQYGEPVLWLGSDERKAAFIKAVTERGASPLEGGRFIHISGDCNKGTALSWFVEEYERQFNQRVESIALGDGKNDIAMLEAASIAVRIASPSHPPPELQKQQNVYTSTLQGPSGWAEIINKLLVLNP